MTKGRVYVETYGCQMNVSDSELMLGRLVADGYEESSDPLDADVILLNTCAIRDHAEQRVLGRLGELKGVVRPGVVFGVTGCMAQRMGPTLLERASHVSLVIGPDGYRALRAFPSTENGPSSWGWAGAAIPTPEGINRRGTITALTSTRSLPSSPRYRLCHALVVIGAGSRRHPIIRIGGNNAKRAKRGNCVLASRRRRRGVGYMAIHQHGQHLLVQPVTKPLPEHVSYSFGIVLHWHLIK